MNIDQEMLKKLVSNQLTPLMSTYMLWITPTAHELAVSTVKTFVYSVEQGVHRWERKYVFILKFHGRDVKFTFHSSGHGDCTSMDIDFLDVTDDRTQIEIVKELTYEIYTQLMKYAIANNIPPQNLVL